MKIIDSRTAAANAIAASYEVDFCLDVDECKELIQALKIVEKYKQAARRKLKVKEEYADMTSYEFENIKDGVRLRINQGAIG